MFLLLLDGMTGAGKTTVSQLLFQQLPRVAVISADKIKWFISDFKRCREDNAIARDVVFSMTRTYLEHKLSVIVEQPIVSDEELQRYELLAKEHSVPVHKVQLFTTPEHSLQRVLKRQEDSVRPVPVERIQRNISLFQNRKDQGFSVFDTSETSAEEIKEKILTLMTHD